MSTLAAMERKLKQAEFYAAKIRGTEDSFEIECYFAAMLACLRSVTQYVNKAGVDWTTKINPWEQRLPAEDGIAWRALVEFRNRDIHEEPIAPVLENVARSQMFGIRIGVQIGVQIGPAIGGRLVIEQRRRIHDDKGRAHDLADVCERGLAVARRLLVEYPTL